MRSLYSKNQILIGILALSASAISVVFLTVTLPREFYHDGYIILNQSSGWARWSSYKLAHLIYQPVVWMSGPFKEISPENYLVGKFQSLLMFNEMALMCAVLPCMYVLARQQAIRSPAKIFFFVLVFSAAVPYLGAVNKEQIVVIAICLSYVAARARLIGTERVLVISFLILAMIFRPYYALMVCYYILMRLCVPRVHSAIGRLSVLFAGYAISIVIIWYSGIYHILAYSRNDQLMVSANTYIGLLFPDNGLLHFFINRLDVLWRIIFPFELVRQSPLWWVYGFARLICSFVAIRVLLTSKTFDWIVLASLFYLALNLVQALFEPDMGSVMRHSVGLLPLFIMAIHQRGRRSHARTFLTTKRV